MLTFCLNPLLHIVVLKQHLSNASARRCTEQLSDNAFTFTIDLQVGRTDLPSETDNCCYFALIISGG